MNDEIWALVGAVILAFIVRFLNVVIQWLARVLGVNPPEPIPAGPASELVPVKRKKPELDQPGSPAVPSPQTTEAPSPDEPEHP